MKSNPTVVDILKEKRKPAVAIDERGIFFFVNEAFEKAYGWKKKELIGHVITAIMPPNIRDAHNFGFSRFLTTESPRILGKHLPLPVYCKDGTIVNADHYIVGEKIPDGSWRFGALIQIATTPK